MLWGISSSRDASLATVPPLGFLFGALEQRVSADVEAVALRIAGAARATYVPMNIHDARVRQELDRLDCAHEKQPFLHLSTSTRDALGRAVAMVQNKVGTQVLRDWQTWPVGVVGTQLSVLAKAIWVAEHEMAKDDTWANLDRASLSPPRLIDDAGERASNCSRQVGSLETPQELCDALAVYGQKEVAEEYMMAVLAEVMPTLVNGSEPARIGRDRALAVEYECGAARALATVLAYVGADPSHKPLNGTAGLLLDQALLFDRNERIAATMVDILDKAKTGAGDPPLFLVSVSNILTQDRFSNGRKTVLALLADKGYYVTLFDGYDRKVTTDECSLLAMPEAAPVTGSSLTPVLIALGVIVVVGCAVVSAVLVKKYRYRRLEQRVRVL